MGFYAFGATVFYLFSRRLHQGLQLFSADQTAFKVFYKLRHGLCLHVSELTAIDRELQSIIRILVPQSDHQSSYPVRF